MPYIQNCSMEDVRTGFHKTFKGETILIQITDPAMYPPIPKHDFAAVFQFEFLDVDQKDIDKHDDTFGEFAITDDQAQELVNILQSAMEKGQSVTVHCVAGVCRSGAVVEVGSMMGFDTLPIFRSPNLLVKHKMMRALGWTYDSDEPDYTVNTSSEDTPRPATGLWDV